MLLSKYSGSVVELLDSCEGKIGGEAGLLMRLDLFKAYAEDPLKKKSAAFISELVGKGLAEFSDMENIPPTVDYHVTRMFIRLGVIDVEEYMDKINSGVEFTLEEDTAVRLNVAEAAKEMAKYSEHNIGDQSFLFWQIARNCCRKDKTWCKQCVKENCTFVKQTPNDCLKRCLFTNVCDNKENALSITEPKIKTTYY